MTDTSVVLVDVSDGVATITLNRPDARNALSLEVLRALPRAVRECDDRDDVRAIVRHADAMARILLALAAPDGGIH